LGAHSLQLGTTGQGISGEALRDVVGSRIYGRDPAKNTNRETAVILVVVVEKLLEML
jgi:hypothetical protein